MKPDSGNQEKQTQQKIVFEERGRNGSIAGKVTLRPNKHDSGGWLQGLFVDADQRNQGIGGRLIDRAIQDNSYSEIRAEISADNTVSLTLHLARGFTKEREIVDQKGNKYFVFVLRKKK